MTVTVSNAVLVAAGIIGIGIIAGSVFTGMQITENKYARLSIADIEALKEKRELAKTKNKPEKAAA